MEMGDQICCECTRSGLDGMAGSFKVDIEAKTMTREGGYFYISCAVLTRRGYGTWSKRGGATMQRAMIVCPGILDDSSATT